MSIAAQAKTKKKNRIHQSFGSRVFDVFNVIFMFLFLLVTLYPFWYVVIVSLSDGKAVLSGQVSLIPVNFTFDTYRVVLRDSNIVTGFKNTVIYTTVGTLINLACTSLCAYPLSRPDLLGKKQIMGMIVFTMFFSGGLIPNYLLLNSLHLVGTRAAMLMPFAINSFNLIILINFFRSIPNEIEEAALIDGLGYFGILRRIVLPLSTAAIATIGLYYAVFFWNDWFNSLIYLKSDQYPVMMFLRNIVNGTMVIGTGSGSAEKTTIAISVKSAVIITSTVPIIVIYPFLQKFFVKGLTIGGVKG